MGTVANVHSATALPTWRNHVPGQIFPSNSGIQTIAGPVEKTVAIFSYSPNW